MAFQNTDQNLEVPSEAAASKFLSCVGDDVLLDIFYRLPHYRYVIQCGMVCKRWFGVVNSHLDEFFQYHNDKLQYSLSFDEYHSSRYFPSCTLLLYLTKIDGGPLYQLFVDNSHTNFTTNAYLKFFPWPDHDMVIRASLDDLFLVSRKCNPKLFYICNLLTKKWIALPEAPQDRLRHGLVCDDQKRYRVVLMDIRPNYFHIVYHVTIFCSESEKWTESVYYHSGSWYPGELKYYHGYIDQSKGISTSDGSVHWIRETSVVIFNPYKKRPRYIWLPDAFGRGMRNYGERARLGVVQGRLRLSEMFRRGFGFVLKVWELSDDNTKWILVHNRVKWIAPALSRIMYVLSFHPNNGDEIFVARNFDICLYNIREDKYKKLGEFPKTPHDQGISLTGLFTIRHPLLPTSLGAFPSICFSSI